MLLAICRSVPYDPNLWKNRENRQRKSILSLLTRPFRMIFMQAVLVIPPLWGPSEVLGQAEPYAKMDATTGEGRVIGQVVASPEGKSDPEVISEGNLLVGRVLATLERRPNISARVRHRVRLGEYLLTGSGNYWQQGTRDERRTRLELQTQVAGRTASLVQIFDSRYLWTDRQLPSGRKVTRLDPIRLQDGLSGSAPIVRHGPKANATSLWTPACSRGGLSGQLADLIGHFNFGPPQSIELDGYSMVGMIGRWKLGPLGKLAPQFDSSGPESSHLESTQPEGAQPAVANMVEEWPDQLPHHVLLLVGERDLFPYMIEYRRFKHASMAGTHVAGAHATGTHAAGDGAGFYPVDDPLARYEQFEVEFTAPLDERLFEFAHTDLQWDDETSKLLTQLQGLD
jgi:hypothetical protein